MVEIFKTNVETQLEAKHVIQQLKIKFPNYKINFDLEDCDKILRVENSIINTHQIMNVVSNLRHHIAFLEESVSNNQ